MSSVQPIGHADVRAAIAVAAQSTGVDFNYLLAQARLESSLDPTAQAGTSSAAGLYQFTGGTWLSTLDRHGAEHGLGWAEAAINGGRVADPALRSQIMALRYDPQVSALMAGELANDNRAILSGALGRDPDAAELYLAHFLGAEGASRFLGALARDAGQSAAAVLPNAAAANRTIFYTGDGAARSVGQVMDLIRSRLSSAMEHGAQDLAGGNAMFAGLQSHAAPVPPPVGGPVAREFHAAAPAAPARAPMRVSMADTLRDAFGLGDGGAAPGHVQAAYSRLRAMGM